jgi:hypothetical protein
VYPVAQPAERCLEAILIMLKPLTAGQSPMPRGQRDAMAQVAEGAVRMRVGWQLSECKALPQCREAQPHGRERTRRLDDDGTTAAVDLELVRTTALSFAAMALGSLTVDGLSATLLAACCLSPVRMPPVRVNPPIRIQRRAALLNTSFDPSLEAHRMPPPRVEPMLCWSRLACASQQRGPHRPHWPHRAVRVRCSCCRCRRCRRTSLLMPLARSCTLVDLLCGQSGELCHPRTLPRQARLLLSGRETEAEASILECLDSVEPIVPVAAVRREARSQLVVAHHAHGATPGC